MGTMMMMEGTVVQSVFDCYSEMTRCDWFFSIMFLLDALMSVSSSMVIEESTREQD